MLCWKKNVKWLTLYEERIKIICMKWWIGENGGQKERTARLRELKRISRHRRRTVEVPGARYSHERARAQEVAMFEALPLARTAAATRSRTHATSISRSPPLLLTFRQHRCHITVHPPLNDRFARARLTYALSPPQDDRRVECARSWAELDDRRGEGERAWNRRSVFLYKPRWQRRTRIIYIRRKNTSFLSLLFRDRSPSPPPSRKLLRSRNPSDRTCNNTNIIYSAVDLAPHTAAAIRRRYNTQHNPASTALRHRLQQRKSLKTSSVCAAPVHLHTCARTQPPPPLSVEEPAHCKNNIIKIFVLAQRPTNHIHLCTIVPTLSDLDRFNEITQKKVDSSN